MSIETVKDCSWNSPRSIKSKFGLTILDQLVNKQINESEAYYILLKWFDSMNVDNPPKDIDIDEFIYANKKEYNITMVNKVQEGFCLVDLLFETDKEKRNEIIDELERIK